MKFEKISFKSVSEILTDNEMKATRGGYGYDANAGSGGYGNGNGNPSIACWVRAKSDEELKNVFSCGLSTTSACESHCKILYGINYNCDCVTN